MSLRDLVNKAQMEILDEDSIKSYLLEFVKDEAIVDALIELEKRNVHSINMYTPDGYIEISVYYKNLKSIKVKFIHKKSYVGAIIYDFQNQKFEVEPKEDDCFGNYCAREKQENLFKMRNMMLKAEKDIIVNKIREELKKIIE